MDWLKFIARPTGRSVSASEGNYGGLSLISRYSTITSRKMRSQTLYSDSKVKVPVRPNHRRNRCAEIGIWFALRSTDTRQLGGQHGAEPLHLP